MTKRTTIKADGDNAVLLNLPAGHRLNPSSWPRLYRYWRPHDGGYVRDVTTQPGTLGRQVTQGLGTRGNTLHCDADTPLIDIIRREYRRAMRST